MSESRSLLGARALVTGAGRRVGRAIALALGAQGVRVAVHFRTSRGEAEETLSQLTQAGGTGLVLQADLSDRTAARALVAEAVDGLGGLDLLVLSAAGYERIKLGAIDDAAWDRTLGLNLSSQFSMAQVAIPALRASRGSIVFLTCSSATTPFRHHLPYVVSKGALRHLMKTLALELAPEIRVNAVAPGTVLPPADLSADALNRILDAVPLKRLGSPEAVAQAVVFLAQSTFVTGHEILVDGGRSVAKAERFG